MTASEETRAPTPRDDAMSARAKGRSKSKVFRTWVKRVLVLLVLAGLGVSVAVAAKPRPVQVALATVRHGALEVTVDEEGRVHVSDRYVVAAPVAGTLSRITVRAGDRIERAQVLARVEPPPPPSLDARTRAAAEARVLSASSGQQQARAQADRVRTALEFARRRAARVHELFEHRAAASSEWDAAEGEVRGLEAELGVAEASTRVAASELVAARAALGERAPRTEAEPVEVRAPVTGLVLRVVTQSEGPVTPGTALIELGDPTAAEVVSEVLTSEAVRVREGAAVRIDGWGGERVLRGRVRRVEPFASTRVSALGVEEQRARVVIDLLDPHETWSALGDGYRVEVHITTWQSDDAVAVRSNALLRERDGWSALVVRDGIARAVRVTIGERAGAEVQVLSGLRAGDRVVVHPGDRVRDGTAVVDEAP